MIIAKSQPLYRDKLCIQIYCFCTGSLLKWWPDSQARRSGSSLPHLLLQWLEARTCAGVLRGATPPPLWAGVDRCLGGSRLGPGGITSRQACCLGVAHGPWCNPAWLSGRDCSKAGTYRSRQGGAYCLHKGMQWHGANVYPPTPSPGGG